MYQCNEIYFPAKEREALARTVVRKHDIENYYHCKVQNCGDTCIYKIVTCPNARCEVQYNVKYTDKHDSICPQKIIPCNRVCGEIVTRCSMDNHLEFACALR